MLSILRSIYALGFHYAQNYAGIMYDSLTLLLSLTILKNGQISDSLGWLFCSSFSFVARCIK